MNRPARALTALVAAGAATAVGIATHDAGFVAVTFIGSLVLTRMLGLGGRHGWVGGCAGAHRARLEERLGTWHRQAHGETPSSSAV